MTKEEIIDVLTTTIDTLYDMEASASNFSNVGRCNEARHKLEEVVKDLQLTPTLPSNLDEAAEEAYREYDVKDTSKPKAHPVGFLFLDGFKAGAEWMTMDKHQ